MQRNLIEGSEFIIYDIDQRPIALSKNCAISIKQNLISTTNKDSLGWAESIAGSRDFSISFEGLVSFDDDEFNTQYFTDQMLYGAPFFVKLGVIQANFDYSYVGEVAIENIEISSSYDNVVSYEGSLKGIGELQFTNAGSPIQTGYLKVETDPVFTSSPAFSISNQDKSKWNDTNNKVIQEVQFVENGFLTTLNLKLKDGSNYTSSFKNVNSVDLSGYALKNITDQQISKAQGDADIANLLLAAIADDSKLTPGEKPNVLKEWQIIADEKPNMLAQALTFGAEILDYTIAYDELDVYIQPLISNLTTTSDIIGATFRSKFRAYYDQKVLLIKAIGEAQKTYVDGIQFGLRNFFFNGDRSRFVNSISPILLQDGNFASNAEFAITFDGKATTSTLMYLYFDGTSGVSFQVNNEWKKYTAVFKSGNISKLYSFISAPATSDQSFPYSIPVSLNYGVELKNIMIVAGNKPLDFTNAPEDFFDLIAKAKLEALNAANAYTEAQKQLAITTSNAYADGIIDQLEQISIDLANENLAATKAYADSQDLYSRTIAAAYADGKITAEEQSRINAVQSSLNAAKAYTEAQRNLSEVTTKAYADGIVTDEEARAIADAQAKLDQAKAYAEQQAAGVKSEVVDIINNSIASTTAALIDKMTADISIASTATLQAAQGDANTKANLAKEAAITASKTYADAQKLLAQQISAAYADGIVTAEEQARINQAQANLEAAYQDATNKANAAAAYGLAAQNLHNALVNNLRGLAYEDVIEVAKLGPSIKTEGGYIKGTLLDVEYIKSSIINAEYITALEVTAKTVQTAASGQRVVISGANNNMVFYNSANTEVLRLDAAIDSGQAGNPLGGIRMNTSNGDTSYCSGNGFFANGSGMQFFSSTVGFQTNASVVGQLRYKNSDSTGISAAVVGVDQSPTDSTKSKSYAGYFYGNVKVTGNIEVSNGQTGISTTQDVRVGGDHFVRMTWQNGVLVGIVNI